MKSRCITSINRATLLIATLFAMVACTSNDGAFPPIANPPPFDYADGEELRSGMHQLAFELLQLDLLMESEDVRDTNYQQEVVQTLESIERISGRIRQSDLSSRHRFLLDDMTRFLSTVSRAKRNAESNPPRYYATGQVSGACTNCHRSAS
ncbi:MAG: hypothetical protein MI746_01320 [Pseudomonadales bacterium]|nr:hypothetical protein [Pseudomonadales bacterium]